MWDCWHVWFGRWWSDGTDWAAKAEDPAKKTQMWENWSRLELMLWKQRCQGWINWNFKPEMPRHGPASITCLRAEAWSQTETWSRAVLPCLGKKWSGWSPNRTSRKLRASNRRRTEVWSRKARTPVNHRAVQKHKQDPAKIACELTSCWLHTGAKRGICSLVMHKRLPRGVPEAGVLQDGVMQQPAQPQQLCFHFLYSRGKERPRIQPIMMNPL